MNFPQKEHYTLDDCAALIHQLRAPDGCPWDREQTHQTIRRNLIEEAYEVADAIDHDDPANLCEELGDLLLQVLFHVDIEADAGRFTLTDVCDSLCRKMIFRHPNLFVNPDAPLDADADWETIKRAEKGQSSHTQVLRDIPRAMPALWRADKTIAKAGNAGLRCDDAQEAIAAAVRAADGLDAANAFDTLGNALLALTAAARTLDCDPEQALDAAIDRAVDRFAALEAEAAEQTHTTPEALWR